MKKCKDCGLGYNVNDFYKSHKNICKKCISMVSQEYRKSHKKNVIRVQAKWYIKNNERLKDKRRKSYYKSKGINEAVFKREKEKAIIEKNMKLMWDEIIKDAIKDKKQTHKKCSKCNTWKLHDDFHKNIHQGDGLASACGKCKQLVITKSTKKRLKTDPFFKFQMLLRGRMSAAFKYHGYKKTSRSHKLLGASFEIVKEHIEKQFIKGMSWDNNTKKGWHLDHIIPLSSAKTEEDLIKLFHYTNLQPLWAYHNISKGGKVPLVSQF